MNLLIVESPAKSKTIQKYLGADWIVKASMGHIADLPAKELGIDKSNSFKLAYQVSDEKKHVVKDLLSMVSKVGKQNVYLATDPDREGEAISFHLCRNLDLDYRTAKRVTFQEITESAIKSAIQKPRILDLALVSAQEARRAIDRLVGYEISPVLWRKIKSDSALSAGRVQSVAVKLIVERERSIESFMPKANIKLSAIFNTPGANRLKASAAFEIQSIDAARHYLVAAGSKKFSIVSINKTPAKTNPQAPFSTSTLQQDANKKLKFSVDRTMQIAQKLYESGHITYMRTDSVNLSESAIDSLVSFIETTYGPQYVERRRFRNPNESSQEAHEAIRPTHFDQVSIDGAQEEQDLYKLIYLRAVASQMKPKETLVTTITINTAANTDEFQAKASLLVFEGYTKAYADAEDDEKEESEEVEINEALNPGDPLGVHSISAKTNYTKPKARFGEADLVKELETLGIGRPSTYASIIRTIKDVRKYISVGKAAGKVYETLTLTYESNKLSEQKGKVSLGQANNKLMPNEIAFKLVDFLNAEFNTMMDYQFTAKCEDQFDLIATGKEKYVSVVSNFYGDLDACLSRVEQTHGDVQARVRKTADLGSFEKNVVSVGKGEFGVYVKHKKDFYNVKDVEDPATLTLERAIAVITASRVEEKQRKEDRKASTLKEFGRYKIIQGQYGPYVTNGTDNAPVPKWEVDKIDSFDSEKCKEILRTYKQYKKRK